MSTRNSRKKTRINVSATLMTCIDDRGSQSNKLRFRFDFPRVMPLPNPRTGILWERDCTREKLAEQAATRGS